MQNTNYRQRYRCNYNSYPEYVDKLRAIFTMRIEVNRQCNQPAVHRRDNIIIRRYLRQRVTPDAWCVQDASNHGLHYVWFTHEHDALAFLLTFNGRIV